MKKLLVLCQIIILLVTLSSLAFANSGPITTTGFPTSDVIFIDHNSPITVSREDLDFDFTEEMVSNSLSGLVTAAYEMYNPTDITQTVQMAFPLVGDLMTLIENIPTVKVDSKKINYDLYIGKKNDINPDTTIEEKRAYFDFEAIVTSITDLPYQAATFSENDIGTLYTLKINPSTDQRVNIAVTFSFDFNNTKLITKGFNGYERSKDKITLTAWVYEEVELELYVIGNDIDYSVSGYSDGAKKKKSKNYEYETNTQELALRPYLMQYIDSSISPLSSNELISELQLYNLFAQSLDNSFQNHNGYCSEHDLYYLEYAYRISTLVYTIDFPPNSTRQVEVTYTTTGTMDKRNSKLPLYTFDYILNPAKNWSNFQNLNISIKTPSKAPFIVNSTIDLTLVEPGHYTASLDHLPEEDLIFTLHPNQVVEQPLPTFTNNITISTILQNVFLLLLVIAIVVFVILKIKTPKE